MDEFGVLKVASKSTSERGLILEDIILELESDSRKKFDKKAVRWVAFKTSHLSKEDLRWVYGNCLRYKKEGHGPFSKAFWGMLKVH